MQQNLNEHDLSEHGTVVVGGGPAGCAAATLLARAGCNVLLFEKTSAAHDKVCGEFISWEAAHYLRLLGLDLHALGAQPIDELRVYDGDTPLAATLPFQAWSLSRRRLDAALLDLAHDAGVDVRRGIGIRKLARSDAQWDLSGAHGQCWHARNVFLASGKADVPGARRAHAQSDFIGFKLHLRLAPAEQLALAASVEVHLFDTGYAGLELVEGNSANLCLLVTRRLYTEDCGKNWGALLAWLGARSTHLQRRLSGAEALWPRPLAVYGTPYGYLHDPAATLPGLYRLGDQMAVIPSLAGDGIAIALHSAFLAARNFMAGGCAATYHRLARDDFHPALRNAALLSKLAMLRARKPALALARRIPALVKLGVQGSRLAPRNILPP
ncbi:MAG: NAD(P)-binding protein [Pseudomonadota bacterium]|nr:NAD(P)-binding protein [Pseudomonadota bacterium]